MSAEIGGIDAASSAGAPQTDRRSASQRIDQLDVLRGIAALSVVLYHMCCSLPLLHTYLFCTVFDVWRGRSDCAVVGLLLSSTPLRTLVAGPEAVVLFFVLSGFVLSLPFIKGRGPRYGDYVILRFFRIYIPAAVSIGIAAFIVNMLRPGVLSESDWVSSFWQQPVQPGALLANLAMLDGALDIPPFNIVMWSLVEELRISLLLPFLVALMLRFRPGVFLLPAVILSAIGYFGMKANFIPWAPARSVAQTAFFILAFVVGIEVCRAWVDGRIHKLQSSRRIVMVAAITALLFYNSMAVRLNFLLSYYLVVCAAAVVISLCASMTVPRPSVAWRAAKWLGRVSYSLYLTHVVVLLTLLRAAHGELPYDFLVLAILPLSLVVAAIYWRFIENPSHKFGKWLVRRIHSKPALEQFIAPPSPRDV
jgi:peptidoglycan/LPS O-acetylase OafA/YrhL